MILAFIIRLALSARSALTALWSIIARYPMQAALIASLCACVWLWRDRNAERVKVSDLTATLMSERESYAEAQRNAAIRAKAAVVAQEARYKEQASHADLKYAEALGDARSALDRYIAANRVRPKAVGGASGGTIAITESGGAESADRSGRIADMVAVTPDDLRICTVNTERLVAARAWATELENN